MKERSLDGQIVIGKMKVEARGNFIFEQVDVIYYSRKLHIAAKGNFLSAFNC